METYTIEHTDTLQEVARHILETLSKKEGATVLALHGELGAGKTTFTQALGAHMGVKEHITSPTFLVMRRYETEDDRFQYLIHIDAYRVESLDEMRVLKFDALLNESSLVVIEWAERIADLLPSDTVHVSLLHKEEDTRTLTHYASYDEYQKSKNS